MPVRQPYKNHPTRLRFPITGLVAVCILAGGWIFSVEEKPSDTTREPARPTATHRDRFLHTDDSHLDKTPPRQPTGLSLKKLGWNYSCRECHHMIQPKWHRDSPMTEHAGIHLDHGNNRFCLNCHHPDNRDQYVDYDGSIIPEHDVVQLCAKCHGTTYREWLSGAHGRRNGYWLKSKGDQSRLKCIECHDPHSPRFKSMQPLPALVYPKRAAGQDSANRPHQQEQDKH